MCACAVWRFCVVYACSIFGARAPAPTHVARRARLLSHPLICRGLQTPSKAPSDVCGWFWLRPTDLAAGAPTEGLALVAEAPEADASTPVVKDANGSCCGVIAVAIAVAVTAAVAAMLRGACMVCVRVRFRTAVWWMGLVTWSCIARFAPSGPAARVVFVGSAAPVGWSRVCGGVQFPQTGPTQAAVEAHRMLLIADLFSLGCLMYFTISLGGHPFDPVTTREASLREGRRPQLGGLQVCGQRRMLQHLFLPACLPSFPPPRSPLVRRAPCRFRRCECRSLKCIAFSRC